MAELDARFSLICRAGSSRCALPMEFVIEIMRPLPIRTIPDAPKEVLGVSIVRGEPLPVVAIPGLFDGDGGAGERLVVIRTGDRRVGLAVNEVTGIRAVAPNVIKGLPPLLAKRSPAVANIGALDGELLVVLDAARLVPDDVFRTLDAEALAS